MPSVGASMSGSVDKSRCAVGIAIPVRRGFWKAGIEAAASARSAVNGEAAAAAAASAALLKLTPKLAEVGTMGAI